MGSRKDRREPRQGCTFIERESGNVRAENGTLVFSCELGDGKSKERDVMARVGKNVEVVREGTAHKTGK